MSRSGETHSSLQVRIAVFEERLGNALDLFEREGLRADRATERYRKDIRHEIGEVRKLVQDLPDLKQRVADLETKLEDAKLHISDLEEQRDNESDDRRRAAMSIEAETELKRSKSGLMKKLAWLLGLVGTAGGVFWGTH